MQSLRWREKCRELQTPLWTNPWFHASVKTNVKSPEGRSVQKSHQRPPQALWYFGHTSSPWVHELSRSGHRVPLPRSPSTRLQNVLMAKEVLCIRRFSETRSANDTTWAREHAILIQKETNNANQSCITISQYWGQSWHKVRRLRKWSFTITSRGAGALGPAAGSLAQGIRWTTWHRWPDGWAVGFQTDFPPT